MRKMENRTPRPEKRDAVFAPSARVPPHSYALCEAPAGQTWSRPLVFRTVFRAQKMEMAVRSARPKNGTVSRFSGSVPCSEPSVHVVSVSILFDEGFFWGFRLVRCIARKTHASSCRVRGRQDRIGLPRLSARHVVNAVMRKLGKSSGFR